MVVPTTSAAKQQTPNTLLDAAAFDTVSAALSKTALQNPLAHVRDADPMADRLHAPLMCWQLQRKNPPRLRYAHDLLSEQDGHLHAKITPETADEPLLSHFIPPCMARPSLVCCLTLGASSVLPSNEPHGCTADYTACSISCLELLLHSYARRCFLLHVCSTATGADLTSRHRPTGERCYEMRIVYHSTVAV